MTTTSHDPPKASALVRDALAAVLYAEAWPHDVEAQRAAVTALAQAHLAAATIVGALAAAMVRPPERLTLAKLGRVWGLSGDITPWACSAAVGKILADRVRAAPFFPRLLWRVEWIPRQDGASEGSVIAWNANHARTKALPLAEVAVARDKACLTPFPVDEEIQFRLGPMLTDLMVLTDSCVYDGVPGLHISPIGVGDVAYARRAASAVGEAMWRRLAIPGLHRTWEDIVAAGGPCRDAR